MRIAKEDVPVQIDVPGATARQQTDFGDVSGYGKMGAEFFSFGAGTDITELLHGLDGDSCQCPHWGYVIEGRIRVNYQDGTEEVVSAGDLYYWPSGHTVVVEEAVRMVEFSPHDQMSQVLAHVVGKL